LIAATPTRMTASKWSGLVSFSDSTPGMHARSESESSSKAQTYSG
jgi:hypothetical protein